MKTSLKASHKIKGPAVFLGQFQNPKDPRFDTLEHCCQFVASCGMKGVELPLWAPHLVDLNKARSSPEYCQHIQGVATAAGAPIVRLTNHLGWQNIATTVPFEPVARAFCPPELAGNIQGQRDFSADQVRGSIEAAANFGFDVVGGFAGHAPHSHYFYPWPPLAQDVIDASRKFHASQWLPHLNYADEKGIDIAWELHPGEVAVWMRDFQRYLPFVDNHVRLNALLDLSHPVLQGIPPELLCAQIIKNADRIKAFHVKEALFSPEVERDGTLDYGPFAEKSARFRGMGDGKIGYVDVFQTLADLEIPLWAVLEWEDCGDAKGNTKGKRYKSVVKVKSGSNNLYVKDPAKNKSAAAAASSNSGGSYAGSFAYNTNPITGQSSFAGAFAYNNSANSGIIANQGGGKTGSPLILDALISKSPGSMEPTCATITC